MVERIVGVPRPKPFSTTFGNKGSLIPPSPCETPIHTHTPLHLLLHLVKGLPSPSHPGPFPFLGNLVGKTPNSLFRIIKLSEEES